MQDTYGRRDLFSIGLTAVSALLISATLDPSVAQATTGQQGINLMFNSSFENFSSTGVAGWTIS
jgi:hypothetical protein